MDMLLQWDNVTCYGMATAWTPVCHLTSYPPLAKKFSVIFLLTYLPRYTAYTAKSEEPSILFYFEK